MPIAANIVVSEILTNERASPMTNICIVTEEFVGLTASGGIGAATTGLAHHFYLEGHVVDVIITNDSFVEGKIGDDLPFVSNVYALNSLPFSRFRVTPPVNETTKSYCIYRFLQEKDYDVVHFSDWLGLGFYTAMARHQGAFKSSVVTHLHGSSEWVRLFNLSIPTMEDLEREAIERAQIENSDLVVSPSEYLINWYREHRVTLPRSQVLNWMLPQWFLSDGVDLSTGCLKTRAVPPNRINEIVFLGRHERRKGFEIFVDALAFLPQAFQPRVTFLGRFDRLDYEFSGSFALRKLKEYRGQISFVNHLGQNQVQTLLRDSPDRRLFIVPSLSENSPCVIGECFTGGAPFLSTAVGGIPELIDEKSRACCLLDPDATQFSNAFLRIWREGLPSIVSTLRPAEIREKWRRDHRLPSRSARGSYCQQPDANFPLVSICLVHHNRPAYLKEAIDGIVAQSYRQVELIVVDDGSTSADSMKFLAELETMKLHLPLKIIRSENRYLGAARNLAARHAVGEYLLFHDDDNIAEPREIEALVAAAEQSNADILTCFFYSLSKNENRDTSKILYYPLGIGGVYSFFKNRFGDANALIRKSVFEKAGGFSELVGLGLEDWEFFLKAYILGYRIEVVPRPLFNYRTDPEGMRVSGSLRKNMERIFSLLEQLKPQLSADFFRVAQGASLCHEISLSTKKKIELEPYGDLHVALMSIEPNSEDALFLFSELARKMGRAYGGDSWFSGSEREQIGSEAWAGLRYESDRVRAFDVQPTSQKDALFLVGWSAGSDGKAFEFANFECSRTLFDVIKVVRYARLDVSEYLKITSSEKLGFRLLARAQRRVGLLDRARLRRGLQRLPSSAYGDTGPISVVSAGRPLLGHVDSIFWCQFIVLHQEPGSFEVEIEIETSLPAQAAVRWRPDLVDFGHWLTARKLRFVRPDGFDSVERPSVIVPCDLSSRISVTYRKTASV